MCYIIVIFKYLIVSIYMYFTFTCLYSLTIIKLYYLNCVCVCAVNYINSILHTFVCFLRSVSFVQVVNGINTLFISFSCAALTCY